MSETAQTIIVLTVTVCAIAYASWRTYKALKANGDACSGCPLKDACQKDKRKRNKQEQRISQ